jgi:SAM-dependent methyltransferase
MAEYDDLDVFVNEWLGTGELPEPSVELGPEMVEYYKTPARVVVELVRRVTFEEGDVFYDLGSGLGQVVLLVHLLTGVSAKGVEIEPAYCEYARGCARGLGLGAEVCFIAGDARDVNLSEGTIFFLFTPFKGGVFFHVMERLRVVAASRRIRVITYGPCSAEIARLDWLKREEDGEVGEYDLQFFQFV